MDKIKIKEKVIECVKEMTYLEEISEENNLKNDLGIDSVDTIDLIMALENKFEIEFNDSDISLENFRYVKNIIDLIEGILNNE